MLERFCIKKTEETKIHKTQTQQFQDKRMTWLSIENSPGKIPIFTIKIPSKNWNK